MKLLTILICTHNRAELLDRVLGSLNGANRPKEWRVKIFVAANACTDGTHQLLESYRQHQDRRDLLPVEWFAEPTPGKSHALNSAIPKLTGEVVAFVDDDHRVDTDFLVNICRASDRYPEASLFCGRILPDWDGTEPGWVHDEGPYRIYPLPVPRYDQGPEPKRIALEVGPLPGGGNLFLRTDVFNRVGMFSTDLGPKGHDLGGGEDSAFVLNALTYGEMLQYVPDVIQHHYVDLERLRFGYLLRKAYQRSRSVSRVHHEGGGVPLYMWRKLAEYSLAGALPLSWPRTRFFLMRIASTLGEMRGLRESQRESAVRAPKRMQGGWLWGGAIFAFAGVTSLAVAVPAETLVPLSINTLLVALVLTAGLVTKSLLDFSQTGPQIRDEILAHYRFYSLYAMGRLSAYTLGIFFVGASIGALVLGAVNWLFGSAMPVSAYTLASVLAIVLVTGRQFCHQLLYIPASLVASSHYRMKRLYRLWGLLTPGRLKLADMLLLTPLVTLVLLTALAAMARGSTLILLAVAAFSATGMMFYFLLCPGKYPLPRKAGNLDESRPNILMIGSDTLRADRIGKQLTPCIDELVKKGTLFTECYVPCARTAPSLISLLTGTLPQHHGIRDNFVADSDTRLPVAALPALLRQQGYFTAALSDWCGADMGKFSFGFDYLDLPEDQWNLKFFIRQGPKDLRLFLSLFTQNQFGKIFLPEIHYLGGVPLTDELGRETGHLLNHLGESGRPFLLNVFFSTTHPPFGSEYPYYTRYSTPDYQGESKFAMARLTDPWEIIRRQAEPREAFDLDQIIQLYDGCVRRFDDEVARIIRHLEATGLAKNTIVVIYSDHGMEFFEHDTWGQGNSAISEHSARIPLLIRDPRVELGQRVDDVVCSIDLSPTLLDLVGVTQPAGMDGGSLADSVRTGKPVPQLDAYNETGMWLTNMPGMPVGHLSYPSLMELLEVPDKASGTLALKQEFTARVVNAKDRMIRSGRWKLVYQPVETGCLVSLFDVEADPECRHELSMSYPDVTARLTERLQCLMQPDPFSPQAPGRSDTRDC